MPLVDSDKWKAAAVSLNSLRFHPNNPRLASLSAKASEREIIEELCERSKVDVIARSIVEKGYLRNERLIVFKDGNRNVVYEGNRRLCALKVLAKPELAPRSKQKTFKRLSEKASLPSKIAIDIVPSIFDAEVVMYVKHAGASYMSGWKPVQQATFISARLEAGEDIDEIVSSYGVSRSEVIKAKALTDLYRMCRVAPLSARAKELVVNPEEFPASIIFERLIEPKKIGTLLGFEITERGLLAPAGDDTLKVLARILDDIAGDVIDTRILNSDLEQLDYVRKLGFSPDSSSKVDADAIEASVNPKDDSPPAPTSNESASPAASSRKPNPGNRSATISGMLFPQTLVCELPNQKLIDLIREGKKLSIKECPNTCSMLLRCVFDISLQLAMEERRAIPKVVSKYKKQHRDRLSTIDLLEEIKPGGLVDIGLDGMEARNIDTLKAKGPLTYDVLHLVIHNTMWAATAENVLQLRNVVIPLIQKAIRKP